LFNIVLRAFVDGGTDSNNMYGMIYIKFENIFQVSKLCEVKSSMSSVPGTCDTVKNGRK